MSKRESESYGLSDEEESKYVPLKERKKKLVIKINLV